MTTYCEGSSSMMEGSSWCDVIHTMTKSPNNRDTSLEGCRVLLELTGGDTSLVWPRVDSQDSIGEAASRVLLDAITKMTKKYED